MTPEQNATSDAWERVFSDSASGQAVLDDMTAFAYALTPEQQVGAARLLLYIQAKRGALRRRALAHTKRITKTTVNT